MRPTPATWSSSPMAFTSRADIIYAYDIVSRVAIPKLLTVTSVNGPTVTTILADVYPHFAFGCRGAFLTNGAVLAGFTLSLGNATLGMNNNYDRSGGGVYCMSYLSVVSNCIVMQNKSGMAGGGAFQGTYINCLFTGNSSGSAYGGGAYGATLINCTVVANSGNYGGVVGCTAKNSIIYFNSGGNWTSSVLTRSCSTGLGGGAGNLSGDPQFVNAAEGDFHLNTNSPCINAGDNSLVPVAVDLDGNPRIVGGAVDLGAYEFQTPASIISYAWLQQYGLPTDGSADFIDTDGDGMNNWQEWRCGTDPTNPASVLKMLAPSNSAPGVTVPWASVGGINYYLQRSTDLSAQSAFSTIQSNITGLAGTTTYTDTNATGAEPFFYRVGVQ